MQTSKVKKNAKNFVTYKNEKKTTALMHKNFPIGCIGFSASEFAR